MEPQFPHPQIKTIISSGYLNELDTIVATADEAANYWLQHETREGVGRIKVRSVTPGQTFGSLPAYEQGPLVTVWIYIITILYDEIVQE